MESKRPGEVKALKAHVALNVHDIDRSTEFYKKMSGEVFVVLEDNLSETFFRVDACKGQRSGVL